MPSVLILESNHSANRVILHDIGDALTRHGCKVVYEDCHLTGLIEFDDEYEFFNTLSDRVYKANPDFVIFNGIDGIIRFPRITAQAHFLAMLRIPYISLNFESPVKTLYQAIDTVDPPLGIIGVSERAYMDNLRSFGFSHLFYFPGAANTERFKPGLDSYPNGFDPEAPLTFIGNLSNEERLTWQRFSTAVYMLPGVIKEILKTRRPVNKVIHENIEKMVDRGEISRSDFAPAVNAQLYNFCVEEANYKRRLQVLEGLEKYRINAAGRGWEQNRSDHINGVYWVDYEKELPTVYERSPITVSVSSVEGISSVPLNIFDCIAAGGFVLPDYREDIEHYFNQGSEIDCYRSRRELNEKIVRYLDEPSRREDMAGMARERVLREHTWERRVIKLLEEMDAFTKERTGGMLVKAAAPANSKPLVSAVIIARDEEGMLPVCLDSLARDIDDLIVVDTGSRDATATVARQHGGRVFLYPWKHDFSAARNFGIAKARGDWVLIINADEELVPDDELNIADLAEGAAPDIRGISLNITVPGEDDGTPQPRLFRKDNLLFSGAVDETAAIEDDALSEAGLTIRNRRSPKARRGQQLIINAIEEGRGTAHMLFSLIRAFAAENNFEQVRLYGERLMASTIGPALIETNYREALYQLGRSYLELKEYTKALDTAFHVLRQDKTDLDMWALTTRAYQAAGQTDRAFLAADRYQALADNDHKDAEEIIKLHTQLMADDARFCDLADQPEVRITALMVYRHPSPLLSSQLKQAALLLDGILLGNATGTDLTIDLDENIPVSIIEFDQEITEADAWNCLIDESPDTWLLLLTPQEHIDNASAVFMHDLIRLNGTDKKAYRIIRDLEENQTVALRSSCVRLLHHSCDMRFEGALFARMPIDNEVPVLDVLVRDVGRDKDPDIIRRDLERRLSFIAEIDDRQARDVLYFYDLTRVYVEAGNWPLAVVNGQKALVALTSRPGPGTLPMRKYITILLAQGLLALECGDEADRYLADLAASYPDYPDAFYLQIRSKVLQGKTDNRLLDIVNQYFKACEAVLTGTYQSQVPHISLFRQGEVRIIEGAIRLIGGKDGYNELQDGIESTQGMFPDFVYLFLEDNLEQLFQNQKVVGLISRFDRAVDSLLLLIQYYALTGDNDLRLNKLQRLERISAFHRGDATFYQAEIYLENMDRQKALEMYIRAIGEYQAILASGTKIPPDMLIRYAECLERTGRITTAISVYEVLLNAVGPADAQSIKAKIDELQSYLTR